MAWAYKKLPYHPSQLHPMIPENHYCEFMSHESHYKTILKIGAVEIMQFQKKK
jgi:hypothetical protein